MRILRALSARRVIVAVPLVLVVAVLAAVLAVAATGGGAVPPTAALPEAVHAALVAPPVQGITARVTLTNKLFPSGALLGSAGPALLTGGTGRLWLRDDGRGRLELQSGAGDAQVVWNDTTLTVYDASSNTVYRASLPARGSGKPAGAAHVPPSLAKVSDVLARIGTKATIAGPTPSNVAGQPAYTVSVSPKHDGGLLGSVELAWDAARGVPLRIGVYAQGASAPVLELVATQISYGPVAADTVAIAPPASAKKVDLGSLSRNPAGGARAVSGLAQVQAAAPFTVSAPPTLVGLPRQDVRLVGGPEPSARSVVAVYGKGLGAIVLIERKAGAGGTPTPGVLAGLPTVSLGTTIAHELATQLGTILAWERGGVAFTLAGSIPAAAAEAAARELR